MKARGRRLLSILILLMLASSLVLAKGENNLTEDNYSFSLRKIVATDSLGRTLPAIGGYREDRYVGLFYFTWLGQQGEPQTEVYDITKLLREDRESLFDLQSAKAPKGYNYFFNEPLYGYYNNADPWVIRKHIEMFIVAGIDFLALDFTNAIVYSKVLIPLLDLLLEYKEAGWKVPQVTFFTNTQSGNVTQTLYNGVYKKDKYKDLWFYGKQDKPYLIAWEEQLSQEMRDFFYIRPPQWPEADFNSLGFPYVEKVRPQRLFDDLISVSVAQHTGDAFSFSIEGVGGNKKESCGRGYTTDNPVNGDIEAILRGDNFQEQWDYAISQDPEIIFITGWNEWTALKLSADWAGSTPFWVDTFNTEFSRDIEMTKATSYLNGEEGYGDNFYLQMVMNIRRYKGIPISNQNELPKEKTIVLNDDLTQWDDVTNSYLNISFDKIERDFYGYVKDDKYLYKQEAPANFIKEIKVTNDRKNIYFLIIADKDIVNDAKNMLNLLIGVNGLKEPSWEGFHFIVNKRATANKTSLDRVHINGKYILEEVAQVDYLITGKAMQISIPKEKLKLASKFSLTFKLTDSIEKEDDIMDYYVSGDSLPLGRLTYSFSNTPNTVKKKTSLNLIELALLIISLLCIGFSAFALVIYKKKKQA